MFNVLLIALIAVNNVLGQYDFYEYGDVKSDYQLERFNETFECLGENKTVIRFNNTGEIVPGLWTTRIVTPTYGSQYAANYLVYLFMREKLGVNARFWPYANGPQWYGSYTVIENSTGDNETYSYPDYYWHWIEDDITDMAFDIWPIQEDGATASAYYARGSVDRSFITYFGEVGFYMPKYFVDMYPTAIVPNSLATDETLRQYLINGSLGLYGTTNYYHEYRYKPGTFDSSPHDYSDIRREWFEGTNLTRRCSSQNMSISCVYNALNLTQDINYTYPIIWGSAHSWIQAYYGWNITRNLDMNVSFVTTGSESNLRSLVTELYTAGAPFIANSYIPDDNFATLANVSTWTYQEFEKVALPFNSGQNVEAECYQRSMCANPLEAIKKLKNPLLDDRFPEMTIFWEGIEISADQLALLQAYYNQLLDVNMTEHNKWLNASCAWLKDPDSEVTWNTDGWLVDVDRWDCVPGCGVKAPDNTYLGGTCDYLTNRATSGSGNGTCNCDDSRLYGDDCDLSCPGLGTTWHSSNMTYVIEYCSGHGSCDDINYQCTCDEGHGGSDCGTKYDKFEFEVGLAIVIIIFASILAICGVLSIVWLRMNAKYKTVKALSVDMTTIMTIGIIFLALSNIPLVSKVTDASCIAWQFLFGVGGIMAIISPLLKAYRVSRVFHGGKMLRAVKITDKMLMKQLIQALLVEVIIVAVYTFMHQFNGGTELYYNDEELRVEPQCNQASSTSFISLASYGYFFILLCALTYYSYGTRRALSVFKESTCAYFSSFLSLFCTLITFGFNAATDDPLFRNTVQGLAIIIVVTEVLIMFFGTRIYTFFTEPENRNVTDGRSISSTTTTSHFANNAAPPKPGPQNA